MPVQAYPGIWKVFCQTVPSRICLSTTSILRVLSKIHYDPQTHVPSNRVGFWWGMSRERKELNSPKGVYFAKFSGTLANEESIIL